MFSIKDISTITITLFAIIDIIGGLPVIISIKNRQGHLDSGKATLSAGALMIVFLLIGEKFLGLFGIDLPSFTVSLAENQAVRKTLNQHFSAPPKTPVPAAGKTLGGLHDTSGDSAEAVRLIPGQQGIPARPPVATRTTDFQCARRAGP